MAVHLEPSDRSSKQGRQQTLSEHSDSRANNESAVFLYNVEPGCAPFSFAVRSTPKVWAARCRTARQVRVWVMLHVEGRLLGCKHICDDDHCSHFHGECADAVCDSGGHSRQDRATHTPSARVLDYWEGVSAFLTFPPSASHCCSDNATGDIGEELMRWEGSGADLPDNLKNMACFLRLEDARCVPSAGPSWVPAPTSSSRPMVPAAHLADSVPVCLQGERRGCASIHREMARRLVAPALEPIQARANWNRRAALDDAAHTAARTL